jgi:hypothetical protein
LQTGLGGVDGVQQAVGCRHPASPGVQEATDEALRVLPEEVERKQLREFGDRHGIGSDTLTDAMGGSP